MRFRSLAAVLIGLALLPGVLQAQVKPAIDANDSKKGTKPAIGASEFVPANPDIDYQHGKYLRLTLKGKETPLVGTLVRDDKKSGQLFVRTNPGAAPQAIAKNDIAKSEKKVIMGGITRVVDGQTRRVDADVALDEIYTIEIINGTRRTVSYYAPTLSPGERSQLVSLERAENEMARVGYLSDLENQVLENQIGIQTAQRVRQELLTQQLLQQPPVWGFGGFYYGGYANSAGYSPAPITTPKVVLLPETVTTARQNLLTAQRRGVFEQGRLVAVIDEK